MFNNICTSQDTAIMETLTNRKTKINIFVNKNLMR